MRILQFGTGRFLRGFFDPIVSEPHSVTVVQSRRDSQGARQINATGKGYHVWTRGKSAGKIVDEFEVVRALDGALVAPMQWQELLELAADESLKLIVSNTTESGLSLSASDDVCDFAVDCPESFPAKLAALLRRRFERSGEGLTILPMELVENNGHVLRDLVLRQAQAWKVTGTPDFLDWLKSENRWLCNLVDRIVVLVSESPPWKTDDPLAVVAEPYRLLAIADDGRDRTLIPNHAMVQWVADLRPFFERKVRILNGLHTAMVAHAMPLGFTTVLEVISDREQRAWIDELLQEEILPVLRPRIPGIDAYAAEVIERFENPFYRHELGDIFKNHATKLKTRLALTAAEYKALFGIEPPRLTRLLNAKMD